MKVRCIRLLNSEGYDVDSSPWLTLGRIYHVMSTHIDYNGQCSYGIINSHPSGEWPQLGRHQSQCFEVVSNVIPSNWREWRRGQGGGMSPVAWQTPGFYEKFYDHEPEAYSIFEQERDVIFHEDP